MKAEFFFCCFSKQGLTLDTKCAGNSWIFQLKKIIFSCRYGYHISKTSYFLCYDPPTIKRIFEKLRNFDAPQSYPKFCGIYNILHVRDVTTGYDSSQPNKKSVSYKEFLQEKFCFWRDWKLNTPEVIQFCCLCRCCRWAKAVRWSLLHFKMVVLPPFGQVEQNQRSSTTQRCVRCPNRGQ